MRKPTTTAYLITATLLLALWQVTALWAGETIVPTPGATVSTWFQEAGHRTYWIHFLASTGRILVSLTLAFITAVPLGLAFGASRRADRATAPFIYLTYPVPKIVFLPLVLLIFGLGDRSKVFLIGLIVFFQLLITTRDAARQITTAMRYSMKSLGATRWDFFRHVVWPVSCPAFSPPCVSARERRWPSCFLLNPSAPSSVWGFIYSMPGPLPTAGSCSWASLPFRF